MSITGAEHLLFGVEDMEASRKFLTVYGLIETDSKGKGASFRALDGSGVDLLPIDDPDLPPTKLSGSTLRATTWGVKELDDLDTIAAELGKDREVIRTDGVVQSIDDEGNVLRFRISQRTPYDAPLPPTNVAGHEPVRVNTRASFEKHGPARQLGHIVYWSPDPDKAIQFYVDRLGFRVTDAYTSNAGVFARADGHPDHHSLFLVGNPTVPPGFQHVEFTFGDVQDVFTGGYKLTRAGFDTLFGPGRFELGSNWFWYFKTPMGGAFELGADMDHLDDEWVPGTFDFPRGAPGWHMNMNWEVTRD